MLVRCTQVAWVVAAMGFLQVIIGGDNGCTVRRNSTSANATEKTKPESKCLFKNCGTKIVAAHSSIPLLVMLGVAVGESPYHPRTIHYAPTEEKHSCARSISHHHYIK